MPYNLDPTLQGLTAEELKVAREKHGFNQPDSIQKKGWHLMLLDILKEPMLLLLIAVTVIYLLVGNYGEALFMLAAIAAVSGISFYQDNRSKKALEALEKLNDPLTTVIRDHKIVQIPTNELAVGDLCIVEEGNMINADGQIVQSSDFSVNESSLTGESYSVYKNADSADNQVYSGTQAVSGLAVFRVDKIGNQTKIGHIGQSITNMKEEASPLKVQITKFVKYMAIIGVIVFLMVCIVSFWRSRDIIESLLTGLTLAMSILPEEIPVAFTTFMALGAWKLMKEGVIVKRSSVVETLGSTTVICTDKTGTITANTMQLQSLYDFKSNKLYTDQEFHTPQLTELIQYAMWSSEPVPFDPMEKTIHHVYQTTQQEDSRPHFNLIHEYPLEGTPPMMTHVFTDSKGHRIIAAKGAPEAILEVSKLSTADKEMLRARIHSLGKEGYRILGVAKSDFAGDDFPPKQQDLPFEFLGLTVFYDPPKKNIQQVFQKIYDAHIKVKIITGDNADTTAAIAKQAGILNEAPALDGKKILEMPEPALSQATEKTTLFTRMFPQAKLAIINNLKNNGEVVAMLGDGVNDAPALKAAHIGVAMGHKGTEIAKAAALMVITNDDLGKLILGIAAGRRIYTNIKKAVQYIISIHIPIILTVSLPLFLGWIYPNIFTPIHVIFLELIMGPTCSIVYENEPLERNAMQQYPRRLHETFLNFKELGISIIQGLVITAGVLFVYQYAVHQGHDEQTTRAFVFTNLIIANILLSLVNRSFIYSVFSSLKNNNKLFPYIIITTLFLLAIILYVPPVASFFQLRGLHLGELGFTTAVACCTVLWFEIYKWIKRR